MLANEKSTRNGIDKAINQITLGGLYFDRYEYDKAQPCYSEGVAQLPEDYQNYAMLKKRSDVLDELAVYSQNVTLQDSLLALSKLSPEEQQKVADRLVKELKDKEKKAAEEAALQALASRTDAAGSQLKSNTQNYTLNTDKSWYFYNTATKNAGKTEFQRRWAAVSWKTTGVAPTRPHSLSATSIRRQTMATTTSRKRWSTRSAIR